MSRKRTAVNKPKAKVKPEVEPFSQQESTPETLNLIHRLKTDLGILKKHLFQWSVHHPDEGYFGRRDRDLLCQYIAAQHEYF